MIDIYGYNLKLDDPVPRGQRTKILSIPAENSGELNFINPTVKNDLGNAESMDFSLQSGTPFYDAMQQMLTYIEVEYDGSCIFYGRVLTIENGNFGTRKVKCEGALSLLIDSQYPGAKEKEQISMTVYEYLQKLIENHYNQVAQYEPEKRFVLGEVPGNYSSVTSNEQRIKNDKRKFENTSWKDTKSCLEELKDYYGGVFRTRYKNGNIYLDWLNNYFRSEVNNQTIEVGKNLIDISDVTEVNNIFTMLVPIGKTVKGDNPIYLDNDKASQQGATKYMPVSDIVDYYINKGQESELYLGYHTKEDYAEAVDRYGIIFKVQEFSEAHSVDELIDQACEWIRDNYQGGVDTFTVKAIDLHLVGAETDEPINQILVGDQVKLKYVVGYHDGSTKKIQKTLTCTSINYDLYNPEANSYTFGIPANMLKTYSGKNSTDKNKTSGGGGSPDGDGDGDPDPYSLWMKDVFNWLWKFKPYYNSTALVPPHTKYQRRWRTPDGVNDQYYYFLQPTNHDTDLGDYEIFVPNRPIMTQLGYREQVPTESRNNFNVRAWNRYTSGLNSQMPKGKYVQIRNLTHAFLERNKIYEYIIDEYGVDLRCSLEHQMPSVIPTEEGDGVFVYVARDVSSIMSIGAYEGIGHFLIGSPQTSFYDDVGTSIFLRTMELQSLWTSSVDLLTQLFAYGIAGEGDNIDITELQDLVTDPTTLELSFTDLTSSLFEGDTSNFILNSDSPLTSTFNTVLANMQNIDLGDVNITNTVVNMIPNGDVGSFINSFGDVNIVIPGVGGSAPTNVNLRDLFDRTRDNAGKISTLTGRVSQTESDISDIFATLSDHESRIAEIESKYITAEYLKNGTNDIHVKTVTANHYYVGTTGQNDLINNVASAHITLNSTTNIYTLHLYDVKGQELSFPGKTLTFSRATTLELTWSGGNNDRFPLKVTAVPQGNIKTIGFSNTNDVYLTLGQTDTAPSLVSGDDKSMNVIVALFEGKANRYQTTLTIDTTLSWDKGRLYGRNETEINAPTYSSAITSQTQTATFTTDAPTPKSRSLYLRLIQDANFNATTHKKYVYIQTRNTASEEWAQEARLEVNASTVYEDGRKVVQINAPTYMDLTPYSGKYQTFTYATFTTDAPSPANSRTLYLKLTGGTSWSSNKTTVYLQTCNTQNGTYATKAQIEVNAGDIYTAGRKVVQINAPTYMDLSPYSGKYQTFTYATFTTDAPSPANSRTLYLKLTEGSWDNSNRKVMVYLQTCNTQNGTYATKAQLEINATNFYKYAQSGVTINYLRYDGNPESTERTLVLRTSADSYTVYDYKMKLTASGWSTLSTRTNVITLSATRLVNTSWVTEDVAMLEIEAPAVTHTITGFDVNQCSTSQGYTVSDRTGTIYNNSNGYAIYSEKTSNVAVYIGVKAGWRCDGVLKSDSSEAQRSYLKLAPTNIYKRGWNDCVDKAKSSSSYTIPGTSNTYYLVPSKLN